MRNFLSLILCFFFICSAASYANACSIGSSVQSEKLDEIANKRYEGNKLTPEEAELLRSYGNDRREALEIALKTQPVCKKLTAAEKERREKGLISTCDIADCDELTAEQISKRARYDGDGYRYNVSEKERQEANALIDKLKAKWADK